MAGEINKRLQELQTTLSATVLAKEAYKFFHDATPIKTGNARDRTNLKQNEIVANYPYAQRLDEGWSKQAPVGMTAPTIKYMQAYIKKQEKK